MVEQAPTLDMSETKMGILSDEEGGAPATLSDYDSDAPCTPSAHSTDSDEVDSTLSDKSEDTEDADVEEEEEDDDDEEWDVVNRENDVENKNPVDSAANDEGDKGNLGSEEIDESVSTLKNSNLDSKDSVFDVSGLSSNGISISHPKERESFFRNKIQDKDEIQQMRDSFTKTKTLGWLTKVKGVMIIIFLIAGLNSFLRSQTVQDYQWLARIDKKIGCVDDIPSIPIYMERYVEVCSNSKRNFYRKFEVCFNNANKLDSETYRQKCFKTYENELSRDAKFCDWDVNYILREAWFHIHLFEMKESTKLFADHFYEIWKQSTSYVASDHVKKNLEKVNKRYIRHAMQVFSGASNAFYERLYPALMSMTEKTLSISEIAKEKIKKIVDWKYFTRELSKNLIIFYDNHLKEYAQKVYQADYKAYLNDTLIVILRGTNEIIESTKTVIEISMKKLQNQFATEKDNKDNRNESRGIFEIFGF